MQLTEWFTADDGAVHQRRDDEQKRGAEQRDGHRNKHEDDQVTQRWPNERPSAQEDMDDASEVEVIVFVEQSFCSNGLVHATGSLADSVKDWISTFR
ncbi:MAG: hypothetical protein OXG15_08820 [Gammaproteobacteria bacterium]|nr:hypothetical protein [Gammaproteobacteria bacterium]